VRTFKPRDTRAGARFCKPTDCPLIDAVEVSLVFKRPVISRIRGGMTGTDSAVLAIKSFIAESAGALSCNSSNGSSIYAVELPIFLQRTVISINIRCLTIKETPGSITSVTFCAGFTVWTANTIVAGSAGARSSNTTNGSSIYAVEVPITLERTIIRRICTSYTIKEAPGSIPSVAFCAGFTVWTTNIIVAGSAGTRPSRSTYSSSINAVEVSTILNGTVIKRIRGGDTV
jgi:hypothetical protein